MCGIFPFLEQALTIKCPHRLWNPIPFWIDSFSFKGFMQLYQLQTENDEEETWKDLVGFTSSPFTTTQQLASRRVPMVLIETWISCRQDVRVLMKSLHFIPDLNLHQNPPLMKGLECRSYCFVASLNWHNSPNLSTLPFAE